MLASTRPAVESTAGRLFVDQGRYRLVVHEEVATKGPLLTAPDGLVELRRNGVTVLTGAYDSDIGVHLERHDQAPVLDLDGWDEAVEFSVQVGPAGLSVSTSTVGPSASPLPKLTAQRGSVRVRLQARGRQAGPVGERRPEEIAEDHTLLVWPAAPAACGT